MADKPEKPTKKPRPAPAKTRPTREERVARGQKILDRVKEFGDEYRARLMKSVANVPPVPHGTWLKHLKKAIEEAFVEQTQHSQEEFSGDVGLVRLLKVAKLHSTPGLSTAVTSGSLRFPIRDLEKMSTAKDVKLEEYLEQRFAEYEQTI